MASLLLPRARSLDDVRAILYSCAEASEALRRDPAALWLYAWAAWFPW